MKTYKAEVTWEMRGTMFITAKNRAEAKSRLAKGEYDDVLFEDRTSDFVKDGDLEVHDDK